MQPLIATVLLAAATQLAHAETATNAAPATPPASSASGVDAATAARRAADTAALEQAVQLIRAHQLQAAVDKVLSPLIAAQDAEHPAESGLAVYCANSPSESLLYLVRSAAANQAAAVTDGTWCTALFMRGYAEVDLGQLSAAESDFTRASTLSPANPHYVSELGALHARQHEWPQALAFYRRALEIAPAFPTPGRAIPEQGIALRGIGYVDVELGRLDEAEAAYRHALDLDPADQKSRNELGYVQAQKAKAAGAK